MGISIVLFPVIGLTIRFALKPTVEALSRFFDNKELGQDVHIMERRMALMEQQIQSLESNMQRLVEVTEFHAALQSGGGDARTVTDGSDTPDSGSSAG